jgi:hypothetical protein
MTCRVSALSVAPVLCLALAACGNDSAQQTLCLTNLKQMWTLHAANAQRDKDGLKLPTATGSAFWTSLYDRAGAAADPDMFVCPCSGTAPSKGTTTYRGPKSDVNKLGDDDVVGCCSGHHGDGSLAVIRKNGSVILVPKGDPLHQKAIDATAP